MLHLNDFVAGRKKNYNMSRGTVSQIQSTVGR